MNFDLLHPDFDSLPPAEKWNVIDDKIGVRRGIRNVVPVLCNCIFGKSEVNCGNWSDCINAEAFCVCSKLLAFSCVIACNVSDDCDFALCNFHNSFKSLLSFFNAQVNAFAWWTAYIKTCNTFADKIFNKILCCLWWNVTLVIIAGIKGRNNAFILVWAFCFV